MSDLDQEKDGGVRGWMNEHSGVVTLIVVAIIVIAGVVVVRNSNIRLTAPPADALWYYDITTHQLVALSDTVPSGTDKVVRAYAYTCGEPCDSVDKLIVRYYETWKPDSAAHMVKSGAAKYAEFGSDLWYEGRLVSKSPEGPWVDINTKAGHAVQGAHKCPPDTTPRDCSGPKG